MVSICLFYSLFLIQKNGDDLVFAPNDIVDLIAWCFYFILYIIEILI